MPQCIFKASIAFINRHLPCRKALHANTKPGAPESHSNKVSIYQSFSHTSLLVCRCLLRHLPAARKQPFRQTDKPTCIVCPPDLRDIQWELMKARRRVGQLSLLRRMQRGSGSHLNTTSSGNPLSMFCSVLFQDGPCDLCSRLRPGRDATVGRPERRQLMQGKGFLFVSFFRVTYVCCACTVGERESQNQKTAQND